MDTTAEKEVNIRYEADTPEEFDENIERAKEDYNRLISEGYPCVRIVVSNHAYSEGIWVEAGEKYTPLSSVDHVYKTNQK